MIAWLLGLLLLAGPLAPASAQDPSLRPVPALSGRVVDQAGVLQPAERERIEAALAALEQRKGAQIAVLTVPAIAPEPVASYALRVVEAWRLGPYGLLRETRALTTSPDVQIRVSAADPWGGGLVAFTRAEGARGSVVAALFARVCP